MKTKSINMKIDHENGVKYISIKNNNIVKTVSIVDEGISFLNQMGVDIVLDFDENDKLVGIELLGF